MTPALALAPKKYYARWRAEPEAQRSPQMETHVLPERGARRGALKVLYLSRG